MCRGWSSLRPAGRVQKHHTSPSTSCAGEDEVSMVSSLSRPNRMLLRVKSAVREAGRGQIFASVLDEEGSPTRNYLFEDVWEESGLISYLLHSAWGVERGDVVVLCYADELQMLAPLLACLRAGIIPVLLTFPDEDEKLLLPMLSRAVEVHQPSLILADTAVLAFKRVNRGLWPENTCLVCTDRVGHSLASPSSFGGQVVPAYDEPEASEDENTIAFYEFTDSASIRPVYFSEVLARVGCTSEHVGMSPSYLQGLAGLSGNVTLDSMYCIMAPFISGWRMHYIPSAIIRSKPLTWLSAVSRQRCQWVHMPLYAYSMASRMAGEAGDVGALLTQIDLSCIKYVETHMGHTDTARTALEKFSNAFMLHGLVAAAASASRVHIGSPNSPLTRASVSVKSPQSSLLLVSRTSPPPGGHSRDYEGAPAFIS